MRILTQTSCMWQFENKEFGGIRPQQPNAASPTFDRPQPATSMRRVAYLVRRRIAWQKSTQR